MDFFLVYLIESGLRRVWEFFRHWYVKSFFIFSHKAINFLEQQDQAWALKITVRHFFEPLYQDYTVLGYILGFIFRTGRIIFGSLFYAIVIAIFAAAYLVWLAIPPYLIIKIFTI